MAYVAGIVFTAITIIAFFVFFKKLGKIARNIHLGKPFQINDQKGKRIQNVLLLAFGQKKMFRNPLVAILHLFVYVGFVIINIELLEIIIDGIAGTHRFFAPFLGGLYPFLINSFEVLALLVFVACIFFLSRRNIIYVKRLVSKDLTGWQATSKDNQWVVKDGVLTSPRSGSNIRTEKTFNDFKLHIEFRYPKESNSGVYLRGRYEIQIEDNIGMEPMSLYLGGIYGFIDPWLNMAKAPGEWQSFDVELVGRMVTVIANGTTVIYKQEIPGVTGGALDSKEGEPGPLMMQGDHGPIEYRNIILTPAIN